MDRVPDYESVGWGFESPPAHQAQSLVISKIMRLFACHLHDAIIRAFRNRSSFWSSLFCFHIQPNNENKAFHGAAGINSQRIDRKNIIAQSSDFWSIPAVDSSTVSLAILTLRLFPSVHLSLSAESSPARFLSANAKGIVIISIYTPSIPIHGRRYRYGTGIQL